MESKYQQLAEELKEQIKLRHFKAGDKLPGLREFGEQKNVSMATALSTYRKLENDGYVEARNRSGYYVKTRSTHRIKRNTENLEPCLVSSKDLILAQTKSTKDPSCINLGSALPGMSFLPVEAIRKSTIKIAKQHKSYNQYEKPAGSNELRLQVAKRMIEAGVLCNADDVVITNGCQEALLIALRTVTKPGQIVAVESPTFYGLLQVIESLGLKAIEIPTSHHKGISIEALEFAADNWPISACIVSPNINNPLGFLMSDGDKQKLVDLAAAKKFILIEDDTYGDLVFASKRNSCLLAFDGQADIIYCSSFSKSIAPDFRIGWIIAPKHTKRLEIEKFNLNISTSSLIQCTVADIIKNGSYDRHLRRVRLDYEKSRDLMKSMLQKYITTPFTLSEPKGGFVYWLSFGPDIDSIKVAQQALNQSICIAPGELFSPSGKYKNCIRISYSGEWSSRIESALKTLGKIIQEISKNKVED